MPQGFPGKRTGLKVLAVFGLAFLFLGCNKIRLTYQYADWMVLYTVRDNFDLNSTQRDQLNRDVKDYFQWNRREMLPLYSTFLSQSADSLRGGLGTAAYDSANDEYHTLFRKTLQPVVDKAQALLLSLSPEQIDAYAATLKKKNDKLRREYSRPRQEILEKRFQKSLGVIEDWIGTLNPDQKARLRPLSEALPWMGDVWLDNREKVQAELIRLLRSQASPESIRPFLETYFLDPENLRSPAYRQQTRAYQAGLKRFLLELRGMLTPAQLDHLIGEMKSLAHDFDDLHKKG